MIEGKIGDLSVEEALLKPTAKDLIKEKCNDKKCGLCK
jgi:hypothetical protein